MDSEAHKFLQHLSVPASQEIVVSGHLLGPRSVVRLKPRGHHFFDKSLTGRTGLIESIEEDDRGEVYISVILEDDPGRDLVSTRHPAHRFFFRPDEIEPNDKSLYRCSPTRILVAGIGNIFFGDDGFGAVVARKLKERPLPAGIEVVEFGIRGMDLAYALGRGYDSAILIDAVMPRGAPGRLHLIELEAEREDDGAMFDNHHMDPVAVIGLARRIGTLPPKIFLVGCEPENWTNEESMSLELSPIVTRSVEGAIKIVLDLAERLLEDRSYFDMSENKKQKGAPK